MALRPQCLKAEFAERAAYSQVVAEQNKMGTLPNAYTSIYFDIFTEYVSSPLPPSNSHTPYDV
jgi:hypothetical protein